MASRALRITSEMVPLNAPFYLDIAASTRSPCADEFRALMRCLSTPQTTGTCIDKYQLLKSCLRAHGLSL